MIWFYDLEILEIQNVIIFFAQRLWRERNVCIRGGVEDTTFEAKTKNSKKKYKAKAKDRIFEDKTSRGQEQKWSRSRPRTEETFFLNYGW